MDRAKEPSSRSVRRRGSHLPGYQFVWIKSKGAILSLLLMTIQGFTTTLQPTFVTNHDFTKSCTNGRSLHFVSRSWISDRHSPGSLQDSCCCGYSPTCPCIDNLGTIRVRYKRISTMSEGLLINIVSCILWICSSVCSIWFSLVNYTFGLDQLMDAPSAELSAYIHWLKFSNTAA